MKLDALQAAGFKPVATWRRSEDGLSLCDGVIPPEAGLYLFAVGQQIRYVGSAANRLDKRMQSYQRRQKDMKSKRPVHQALARAIAATELVDVYVLPIVGTDDRHEWNGLPSSVLVGVEAALIADINPLWNRRGKVTLLDTQSVNDDPDDVDF